MENHWERGKCAVADGLRWDPEANPMAKSALQNPPKFPVHSHWEAGFEQNAFPVTIHWERVFPMGSDWEPKNWSKSPNPLDPPNSFDLNAVTQSVG